MISLSLGWLLHHTPITGIILGASKQSQLDANVAAANEGPLSPETLDAINRVWANLRGITPQYNR
jgi:aryl-alcohol dehydrogenase-like predicted oxidoreductase